MAKEKEFENNQFFEFPAAYDSNTSTTFISYPNLEDILNPDIKNKLVIAYYQRGKLPKFNESLYVAALAKEQKHLIQHIRRELPNVHTIPNPGRALVLEDPNKYLDSEKISLTDSVIKKVCQIEGIQTVYPSSLAVLKEKVLMIPHDAKSLRYFQKS